MNKRKAPMSIRPTCSCGSKMKLIEYTGYYDGFMYWKCDNPKCNVTTKMEHFEPDRSWKGGYA